MADKKDTGRKDEKDKPKLDYVKELQARQWAYLAGRFIHDIYRKGYAVQAMQAFYQAKGVMNDEAIRDTLGRASLGIEGGNVSNDGLLKAIDQYSKEYDKLMGEATVGDVMRYLASNLKEIPPKVKAIADRYAEVQYGKLDKRQKEQLRVIELIGTLRDQAMETGLYPKLVNEGARNNLEMLVREGEEAKAA
jgi:hypothetical protein